MELILSICMVAFPEVCFEHGVRFKEKGAAAYLCREAAPAFVADWAEKHPRVTVKTWRCAPPTRDA